MGLGEGQRHSRSLLVYNMHNVPSGSGLFGAVLLEQ